jgi:hypothetical protein
MLPPVALVSAAKITPSYIIKYFTLYFRPTIVVPVFLNEVG